MRLSEACLPGGPAEQKLHRSPSSPNLDALGRGSPPTSAPPPLQRQRTKLGRVCELGFVWVAGGLQTALG